MKFISLLFLLAIILIANVTAYSHERNSCTFMYKTLADTIIKMDSVRDSKLLKDKKSKSTTPIKKSGGVADTTKNNSSLKSEVKSHADDSTLVDQEHQITYLYGNARVTYEDFELDADYIRVDQKNHLLFAKGRIDPVTHRYVGRPISKQGKDKPLLSDSLLFNYKTKKGNSITRHPTRMVTSCRAVLQKN